ncbi:MAG: hypothetical protein K2P84_14720 [Undibacterium sp.]|nr:hypothetical protein [Undibacterium sp.]
MHKVLKEVAPRFITGVISRLEKDILQSTDDYTYSGGLAGKLLALTCLTHQHGTQPVDTDAVEEALNLCLSSLPRHGMGLFQGATGILFCALELDRHFGFEMAQDAASDYDAYIIESIMYDQNLPFHFDLISGMSGLTTYATYRAMHGGTSELLHHCIDKLKKMSSDDDGSSHWFTPAAWIRGFSMGDGNPLGCIDLGQAHGQPGVLSALAYAIASGQDRRESTFQLLNRGLIDLAKHERQNEAGHYGTSAGQSGVSRCAWCYGDLGPISALRLAACALGEPSYDAWAERILANMAVKDAGHLGFHDAWMCHGTVGSAWLLHQLSRDHQDLINRIHDLHDEGGDMSILFSLENDPKLELGILEGFSGAALALNEMMGNQSLLHWSLPFLAGKNALKS